MMFSHSFAKITLILSAHVLGPTHADFIRSRGLQRPGGRSDGPRPGGSRPDGPPRGPGGRGKGGGADFLDHKVAEWLSEAERTNLECADTTPTCGMDEDAGIWLCRTLYNPFGGGATESFNVCSKDPDNSIVGADECGCCGDVCPEPCPCECELPNGEAGGVWILVDKESRSTDADDMNPMPTVAEGPKRRCVPSLMATMGVAAFDGLTCDTSCSATTATTAP